MAAPVRPITFDWKGEAKVVSTYPSWLINVKLYQVLKYEHIISSLSGEHIIVLSITQISSVFGEQFSDFSVWEKNARKLSRLILINSN
jgi:hypothetical protein